MLFRAIIERRPASAAVSLPSPKIQIRPGVEAPGEWVFVEAEGHDGAYEQVFALMRALIPGCSPGHDVICTELTSEQQLLQSFEEARTPQDYRRLLQLDEGGRVFLYDPLPSGGWPAFPIFFCSPFHRVLFNTAMATRRY